MIQTETYEWIGEQLEKAREDGVILLPVAHHNLLEQSKVYVDDCTIEHSEELIQMLEAGKYSVVSKRASPCAAFYAQ